MRGSMVTGIALAAVTLGALAADGPGTAPRPAAATPPCVRQLTTYLQDFLDGRPELGDYQELGLSAAEGRALRELRREAAELTAGGPLPSGWADTRARSACDRIERAEATASAKPGWP